MPLVQVDMSRKMYEAHAKQMSVELQQAFIEALDVNPLDKFQVFRPRDEGELVFDPDYGLGNRQNLVLIQILMVHRYSADQKRGLYRAIVTRLVAIGIRKEDILIGVTENGFEDWCAGRLHGE
ncbi:tautomerase family protein [Mesorhizobium sp. BR1-1-16]|uniref:tautomerase family protein n=1 Tax=Mesorhizobium sp. BR1-1-16 TaxID=2876653 RepID=UPI001CCBDA68|nr:tautomerase family protein [Mesorhizobium sp. BR1-1-16]MBZ9937237.1 tautomerase family protein [Mesorhizobium sp. BR1-1-16]HWJ75127.1 tautomerase family protein [Kaistia sp.]